MIANHSISDIEYSVLIITLTILLLFSVKKLYVKEKNKGIWISKETSIVIKGICCIFILMGHYGQRCFDENLPLCISKICWLIPVNMALPIFMFLSGYGLSINTYFTQTNPIKELTKRTLKLYLPLAFVSFTAYLFYILLPDKFTLCELNELMITEDIYAIHHISLRDVIPLLVHAVGYKDWYVYCIIFYYAIFYISIFISNKFDNNFTRTLFIILSFTYIILNFFELPGHYYRLIWAFFLGHISANYNRNIYDRWSIIYVLIFIITFINEDIVQIISFISSILFIYIISELNKKYVIQNKILYFLGIISYFFYLSHLRWGWVITAYLEVNSIIIWIFITICISYILMNIYNKLHFIK